MFFIYFYFIVKVVSLSPNSQIKNSEKFLYRPFYTPARAPQFRTGGIQEASKELKSSFLNLDEPLLKSQTKNKKVELEGRVNYITENVERIKRDSQNPQKAERLDFEKQEKAFIYEGQSIDLKKAESYFERRYHNLLSSEELETIITHQVNRMVEKDLAKRIKLKNNEVRKKVVIVGAGPVGLYQAIKMTTLGYEVSVIEKREENPSRKQLFRYPQDIEKKSQIKELLGKEVWGFLSEKGYTTANVQDYGDAEIFGNVGGYFDTIPIYVQEIILRRFLKILSQQKEMRVSMYKGCQLAGIQGKDIYLEQTQLQKVAKAKITGVHYLIGASGTAGIVRGLCKNNEKVSLTSKEKGMVFHVPNFFIPSPAAEIDYPAQYSIFKTAGITQGEAFKNVLEGSVFEEVSSNVYKKGKDVFDLNPQSEEVQDHISEDFKVELSNSSWSPWNSSIVRFYLRLAGGEVSGDKLDERIQKFFEKYYQDENNPEDSQQKLNENLHKSLEGLKSYRVDPENIESVKNYKENLQGKLNCYSDDVEVSLIGTSRGLLISFIHSDYEKEGYGLLRTRVRDKLSEIFPKMKNISIEPNHITRDKATVETMKALKEFNQAREDMNEHLWFNYSSSCQKENQEIKWIEKKLKEVERVISQRIITLDFHDLDIEGLMRVKGMDTRNPYIMDYIKRNEALQLIFLGRFAEIVTHRPIIQGLNGSKKGLSVFSGVLRSSLNTMNPDIYFSRDSFSLSFFKSALIVQEDLMKKIKKLGWDKERIPVVRIFNTNDIIYIGAEVPENLSQEQEKEYLRLLLYLYFPKEIVSLFMNVSVNGKSDIGHSNKAFSSGMASFPVDIKRAQSSTGYMGEIPFFLVGDESVNAHYLTGSGVIKGWESVEHFCSLLTESKTTDEIQQKYALFQNEQAQSLVKKSERIELLKPLDPSLQIQDKSQDQSFLNRVSDPLVVDKKSHLISDELKDVDLNEQERLLEEIKINNQQKDFEKRGNQELEGGDYQYTSKERVEQRLQDEVNEQQLRVDEELAHQLEGELNGQGRYELNEQQLRVDEELAHQLEGELNGQSRLNHHLIGERMNESLIIEKRNNLEPDELEGVDLNEQERLLEEVKRNNQQREFEKINHQIIRESISQQEPKEGYQRAQETEERLRQEEIQKQELSIDEEEVQQVEDNKIREKKEETSIKGDAPEKQTRQQTPRKEDSIISKEKDDREKRLFEKRSPHEKKGNHQKSYIHKLGWRFRQAYLGKKVSSSA